MIPVAMARISTYFGLGNNRIPKNIIDSSMSGFTPKNNGGIMACKTAPIPTSNAKITKILVFKTHLSYSILISSKEIFPTVHSLSAAKYDL